MKLQEEIPLLDNAHIWIGKDFNSTLNFAAKHFLAICKDSIEKSSICCIALSGGATPKAIYEKLSKHPDKDTIDWSRVFLFFSDERMTEPNSIESNYHTAMTSGIQNLKVPKSQIFRMHTEIDIEENALIYENLILSHVPNAEFDLVMLGIGEDGHTASLFPSTLGLQEKKRLIIANKVPQKNTCRMTFTFPLINKAKNITTYVLGEKKQEIIKEVFITNKNKKIYPCQHVGTKKNPALWILDKIAATPLLN